MRQGSRLGPVSFIVMIDDLRANCELHKFVDDTILTELITPSYSPSNMTDYLSSLLIWTADNDMQLNTFKTREMLLGRTESTSIPSLSTLADPIQRVTTFKLFGLHLDASLSWTTHINTIVSKASKRLHFLKQLKRAGVPPHQLLNFYTTVIRPVLEYASPVWHYSITRAQSYQLESIQKRASFFPYYLHGMTNYRIGRIGTHRHTSTCIGAEFDHIDTAKQGQGYKSTVSGC